MSQKSLIPEPESTYVGTDAVMPPADTALAIQAPVDPPPQGTALGTFREFALSMPVEQMAIALGEFKERRDYFRKWLLSQLKQGVHYGYGPGTEPKWCGADGKPCTEKDAIGTFGKNNSFVPFKQWRPKPPLYAAGADFVCELLGVRDSYAADHEAWVQAGSQANSFVFCCRLYSRSKGDLLGDGVGQQSGASEHLGTNAAVKKAQKRAKVAAVLNWLSLRDLFTQDIQDGADRPLVENPEPKPDAPKAAARAERVTDGDLRTFFDSYKGMKPPDEQKLDVLEKWIVSVLGGPLPGKPTVATSWNADQLQACRTALEEGR